MTSNLQNIFNNALYQSAMLTGIVGKPLIEMRENAKKVEDLKGKLKEYQKNIEGSLTEYEKRKGSARKITPEEYKHSKSLLDEYNAMARDIFHLEPTEENVLWGRSAGDFSHRLRNVNEQEKERSAKAKASAAKGVETKRAKAKQAAAQSMTQAIQTKRTKNNGGLI